MNNTPRPGWTSPWPATPTGPHPPARHRRLVGPKRELFPQYTAGLYDLSYGQMVVSRGLGNQFPCFRLLNRPDVPLVVLG